MNDPVLKPRLLHVAAVGLCRHRSREGFGCNMLGTGTCERRGSKEDWVEAELQCRPGKALAYLAEDSRATTAQQVVPYGGRGCALHPRLAQRGDTGFPRRVWHWTVGILLYKGKVCWVYFSLPGSKSLLTEGSGWSLLVCTTDDNLRSMIPSQPCARGVLAHLKSGSVNSKGKRVHLNPLAQILQGT